MKRSLLIACCVVLCAGAAFAQLGPGGSVALFADPIGTDCNIWDYVPGLLNIYVVHVWHSGTTAVQFSAPSPSCNLGIWLSDVPIFPITLGNSQTGIIVGLAGCYPAPTHVLTMQFFIQGITPPCCKYKVLPDPAAPSGQIEVVDCVYNVLYATGGTAIINPIAGCSCDVPVHETTWGKLKAMYR